MQGQNEEPRAFSTGCGAEDSAYSDGNISTALMQSAVRGSCVQYSFCGKILPNHLHEFREPYT